MHHNGKKCLAIVGGDGREIILMKVLREKGYQVGVFGFPDCLIPLGIQVYHSLQEIFKSADGIILPIPGILNNGILYAKYLDKEITISPDDFSSISSGVPIFVGVASQYLKELADSKGFTLIEIADLDIFAIPNSIPSAEGAIQLAMEKLSITIHGSYSFVIGYGRVAETLCAMLKGLGAEVTVVARNLSQLAKCRVLGYHTQEIKDLSLCINRADVIFNTVPALIITEQALMNIKKEAWIIDLASSPGGTDFKMAKTLGVNVLLASGLPGKVAPETAGKILATVYPILMESVFPRSF